MFNKRSREQQPLYKGDTPIDQEDLATLQTVISHAAHVNYSDRTTESFRDEAAVRSDKHSPNGADRVSLTLLRYLGADRVNFENAPSNNPVQQSAMQWTTGYAGTLNTLILEHDTISDERRISFAQVIREEDDNHITVLSPDSEQARNAVARSAMQIIGALASRDIIQY